MKYGIFYLVTNVYKDYLENFLSTVHYIFPDKEKELIIISDCLTKDDIFKYDADLTNINVNVEKILDFPYPIINLCKFQIIYNYAKKYEIDKILYFDADTIIFEKDSVFWKTIDRQLNTNKLICSRHPHYLYHNEEIFNNLGFMFPIPNSGMYCDPEIVHNNKCYMLSSFFMGSIDIVEYVYKELYEMMSIDLGNNIIGYICEDNGLEFNGLRIIPWHSDETYLNVLNVNDNILDNKKTIISGYYVTINPYIYGNFPERDNENIYVNNYPEHDDTIFMNQKYDVTVKKSKRKLTV